MLLRYKFEINIFCEGMYFTDKTYLAGSYMGYGSYTIVYGVVHVVDLKIVKKIGWNSMWKHGIVNLRYHMNGL